MHVYRTGCDVLRQICPPHSHAQDSKFFHATLLWSGMLFSDKAFQNCFINSYSLIRYSVKSHIRWLRALKMRQRATDASYAQCLKRWCVGIQVKVHSKRNASTTQVLWHGSESAIRYNIQISSAQLMGLCQKVWIVRRITFWYILQASNFHTMTAKLR